MKRNWTQNVDTVWRKVGGEMREIVCHPINHPQSIADARLICHMEPMADAIRSAMAWLYDANTPDDRKLSHLLHVLSPVAKAAGLFIEPHSLAHLTARVKRQPRSLGSSFYYLEKGHAIRVREINPSGTSARCYCGNPEERRISEDYFDVPLTQLQLGPPQPERDEIGEIFHMQAEDTPTCPDCDGTGEIEEPLTEAYPCPHCKGGSEQ